MQAKTNRSTAAELVKFSVPLILSGILQQLYSWVDAFIVGHVEGEMQLAAIGATGSIPKLLVNTILGLATGLSILAAQSYGRGDTSKVRRILSTFLPLLLAVYLILSVLPMLFVQPILAVMDTPQEIFAYAATYLRIVLAGVPFLLVYNLFAAILRAVGNTKVAFYAVLISSGLNIALDVLFIAVLRLGVSGAAGATVASQAAMTVFIVLYTVRKYPQLLPEGGKLFDKAVFREGLSFSVPPALQNSVTSFGTIILQNFMNGFGAVTVLAITTAYCVDWIILLPILNLGAAISSMVARSKGAGDRERIKRYSQTGLVMMVVVAGVLSLVMYFFGAKFIALFGVLGEALEIGNVFFQDLSKFYILFGISTALRGVLEGIGDITCCSVLGIVMLGVRIAMSYVLKPVCGGRTIAFAEGIAWIVVLVLYVVRVWQKRRSIALEE